MRKTMQAKRDMLNGPLFSSIISYTVPIMLTGLLQLLFNAADLIVVGQYRGSLCVGAVSATGAIINLIVNLFIGLSVGAGVAVAHGLGGHQDEEVHRTVHTALPVAIVSGIVLTVIGVIYSEDLLKLMGTPDSVLHLSAKYMRIYFLGMTFSMVYNYSAAILRAAGDTTSPLLFLSIAGVLNVGLNFFFVTLCSMDVDGVAWATIISQGVSAVLVVIALMRRTDACKLHFGKLYFYKAPLLKMIRIGLPAGIQGSLFSISNVIIQSSINSFDNAALMSGCGAAGNLEGFVCVIMNSFHQTAVNYIGQNKGAYQYDRVKKIFGICLADVAVACMVAGGAMCIFGKQLLSIYINDSPDAIEMGMTRLLYMCLPYFLCGIMDVSTGALRGLGASTVPMIISVLGICGIRIAWIYTIFQIPEYHTIECLYISYFVSWVITLIAQSIAFVLVLKKKQNQDRNLLSL